MNSLSLKRCGLQGATVLTFGLLLSLVVGCAQPKEEPPAADEEAPAEEMPAEEEAKPEEKPAEEMPAEEEAKPEEKPAEEMPAEEEAKPEEKPAEEMPAEEEAKPEEKPAEDKQAADSEEPADPSETPAVVWLPEPVEVADSVAETQEEMKPYTEVIPKTELTFDMVPIPGGTFKMGSPEDEADRNDDEGPQVEVKVDPFWMGKCEVTWDEYEQWSMGLDHQRRQLRGDGSDARDELADALTRPTMPYTDMTFEMGKEGCPAICMTQLAAKMYCKWLSAKTGRYYRLPTEAEWEYACRAGTDTAYSFGDDPEKLEEFAWYFDNSDEKYQEVGQKKPNPWGLHDMHGNVSEWVLDQYVPDGYKKLLDAGQPAVNPYTVPTDLYPRTVRGGSWDDDPDMLRSAARRSSNRDWKMQDPQIPQSIWYHTDADFVGFRVVRPLTLPTAEQAKLYEPEIEVMREYKEAQAGKQ